MGAEWKTFTVGRWNVRTLIREPLTLSAGEFTTSASTGGEIVDGDGWKVGETPYRSRYVGSAWWTRGKWATDKLEVELRVSNGEDAGVACAVIVPWLIRATVKVGVPRRWIAPWVLDAREFAVTVGGPELLEVRAAWEQDSCGQRRYLLDKEKAGEGRSYAGRYALWQGVRIGINRHKAATLLFGHASCDVETVETGSAVVPMPEGNYDARWQRERRIWRRARVPFALRTREGIHLEIPGGIPVPGKGENSWDCDDNAICGAGGAGVTEAVANAVQSATRERLRHGGKGWVPDKGWPKSIERTAA